MIQKMRDVNYEMRLREYETTRDQEIERRSEMFQIMNGYENIDNIVFSVKEDAMIRIHEVTLAMVQCRLDIEKLKCSQRTVNEWNILSAYYVRARSVNMFKHKIDLHLRRAGCT